MKRRQFIQMCASGWVMANAAPVLAGAQIAGSQSNATSNKKVIWVMLRGAMDSLHAVIPTFDPALNGHRKALLDNIKGNLNPLHDGYALHPAFTHMYDWYKQGTMLPVVAVAPSHTTRSHFDAQDLLESGLDVTNHESGWLARTVEAYKGEGLAISRSVPISLRGDNKPDTWFPSSLPDADDDLFARLEGLYKNDSELAQTLAQGLKTRQSMAMGKSKKRNPKFAQLTKNCGHLMAKNPNTTCAMLEMGGWDTHNNQAGRLHRQFTLLDEGLNVLKESLGKTWDDTLVIVGTEFGRTVAVNGTQGTDHGTASALFLAGGAVNGGRVAGRWPGLEKSALFEGRDLKPTSDIRSWIGAAVAQHLQLTPKNMQSVFPGVPIITDKLIVRRS